MKTFIYGYSDDLIEFEGAFYDEIDSYDKTKTIKCSDGTQFALRYNGDWKVENLVKGSLFDRVVESVGDDTKHSDPEVVKYSSYSDVVVMKSGLEWIKCGGKNIEKEA